MRTALLTNIVNLNSLSLTNYHVDNGSVAMSRCQVEGRVVAHVGCVNSGAAPDQHLDNLGVAALRGPVQRGELVVITAINREIINYE